MNKIMIGLILFIICNCSRSLESARDKAIKEFEFQIQEDAIDVNLFNGPKLVKEDEIQYVFQWESNIPITGTTIYEISIPRHIGGKMAIRFKGQRRHHAYLTLTRDFSFDDALLTNLFDLPITPKVTNERTNRLRNISLSPREMEDIANFVEIKRHLMEYFFKNNSQYPEKLNVFNLDSLFIFDQFGKEYYYENLGKFVILGTQGNNCKWDFENVDYDGLFTDNREHILKADDDILVKFMPVYR